MPRRGKKRGARWSCDDRKRNQEAIRRRREQEAQQERTQLFRYEQERYQEIRDEEAGARITSTSQRSTRETARGKASRDPASTTQR